jgi:ferritin-like metal-binding protein YciE
VGHLRLDDVLHRRGKGKREIMKDAKCVLVKDAEEVINRREK